ncbi:MAG: M15 family metallopeptidase [Firmicutes bacterium]|nr:M15 family metallopeptidase [Bacillota bacterium]
MKRLLVILLALMMAFTFSACGDQNNEGEDPGDDQTVTVDDQQDADDEDEEEPEDIDEEEPEDIDDEEPEDEPEDEPEAVKDNLVDPSEVPLRGDEPPTGDDKSVRGIPDLIDVLTYDDGDLLVLVNKYHGTVPDYKPVDMVAIDPSLGTWNDMSLKKEAYDAYLEMYNDAKAQGYDIKICSAYRSYDGQQSLHLNALAAYSADFARMYSAYPGRSEHHTGLAVDITSASMGWGLKQDFADYADGKWLYDHCQDYGFILRYTKDGEDITGYMYEPWHFRYVGEEAAKEIMEQGITLEEYLGKE